MKWICRTKGNPDKTFKTRKAAIEWAKMNANGIYIIWKLKDERTKITC